MLTYLGIRPEQQIHTFCGGGIAASVPYFAIRYILKYPRVKLYPGSELEWVSDPRELPFFTYDFPQMMRDTQWLQFWDSQRARMYGISNVSVVDVRSPDAFSQGHVPFALNIPADVFRSNLDSPAKLAETLGQAGVNASHEAVVISGGGLTKESALALVILETLGQKKVSVFLDSMEKWVQLGQAVTRDPTAVGPKRSGHTDDVLSSESSQRRDHCGSECHAGSLSEGVHRFRQGHAFETSGWQGCSRPIHRSAEPRRHAQGGEGHLEYPEQGRGAEICATGLLL